MDKQFIPMKQVFIWLFALLGMVACSDDKELLDAVKEPTPMRIAKNNSPATRSIEEAKAIAADFMAQSMSDGTNKAKAMRAQTQPSIQVLVKDSLPSTASDKKLPIDLLPDTLLYGVTYTDGTILIPSDKEAPTVIGMLDSPTESLPTLIRKNNGNNPLYELLEPVFNPDAFHRLTDEDYMKTIMPTFLEDENKFIIVGSDYAKELEEKKRRERERYIAPKIPVEWEQGEPFNLWCPGRFPAGCVAIAAAQAMTLTGVPFEDSYFDFDDIAMFKNKSYSKDNPDLMEAVAQLVRTVGISVDTHYESSGSWTDPIKAVKIFQDMGMHMSTNTSDIKQTLRDYYCGFVMVVSGRGNNRHCYLIDGYNYVPRDLSYDVYLHTNFGWGPSYNGFYLQNLYSFTKDLPNDISGKWIFYSLY